MANPAQILHGLFIKWHTSETAGVSRGLNSSDAAQSKAALQELRFAAMQLTSIEELLTNMRTAGIDVSKWNGPLDRWTLGLFVYPHGWGSQQQHSISFSDIEMLSMLGDILEFQIPQLSDKGSAQIRDFLTQVENSIDKHSHIDVHLRRHFINLISHIRWCLDNYDFVGEFELEKALQQLAATVSLQVHKDEESSDSPSVFRRLLENWVNPFVVASIAGYAGNNLIPPAVSAITQ